VAFLGGGRQFELRGLRLRDFLQVPAEDLPRGRQSLFFFVTPGGRQRLIVCIFEIELEILQFIQPEVLYCGLE
jgi:hypothetical protein